MPWTLITQSEEHPQRDTKQQQQQPSGHPIQKHFKDFHHQEKHKFLEPNTERNPHRPITTSDLQCPTNQGLDSINDKGRSSNTHQKVRIHSNLSRNDPKKNLILCRLP